MAISPLDKVVVQGFCTKKIGRTPGDIFPLIFQGDFVLTAPKTSEIVFSILKYDMIWKSQL